MSPIRRTGLVGFLVVTHALAGCKGEPPEEDRESAWAASEAEKHEKALAEEAAKTRRVEPKKPVEKTPDGVKLSWKATPGSSQDLTIENTKATASFSCYFTLDCTVRFTALPEGTKVKIGASEDVADSGGSAELKLYMGDALPDVAPATALSIDKPVDPKQKLAITFPDGVKLDGDLPGIPMKNAIEGELKKLKDGKPVLFGKEPLDDKPAQHTIIFPYVMLLEDMLIGSAKTMHEVDLVAIEHPLPPRSANKKCSGYKASGETGPGKELELELVDWEVKLIERRTGNVVDTKKFEADGRCPFSSMNNKATSYPNADAVKAWLRTKRS